MGPTFGRYGVEHFRDCLCTLFVTVEMVLVVFIGVMIDPGYTQYKTIVI